ncbi:uncharacterized protein LOC119611850 [Lucilia sericata]|uniref:uncharacterized protein LOC119611850 n=1 Tax=Lucilia sericata TaxID=13632 RepID=UPI0018A84DCD|nr:uncharacterized protein LOC119611850 [Lucilia sericata]
MASGIVCGRPMSGRGRRSQRRRSGGRRSGGRCLKPGPVGRNPYLNFLRKFRKENCGLSPIETIQEGAKEWKRLKKEDRLKFIEEAFYAPKRRRQSNMSSRGRTSRRRTSRRAGRSRGRINKSNLILWKTFRIFFFLVFENIKFCVAKIGAIQSYFEKPNANVCENINAPPTTVPTHITMAQCTPRKTTRMARRGRSAQCPRACPTPTTPQSVAAPAAARCLRPGPVQRNPFLNFLREYRKTCCGLTAIETVRQGAKAWKNLSNEEKQRYIVEAFYAPKRRRRLGAMCGPVGRRTRRAGRVSKRSRSAMSRRARSGKSGSRRRSKVC